MKLALTLLLPCLLGSAAATAQPLRVDITEGASAPLQISLASAAAPGGEIDPALPGQLLQIMQADLASTALYNLAQHGSGSAETLGLQLTAARTRGSQGMVWLTVAPNGAGTVRVECSYLDVYSGSIEKSEAYTLEARQTRRAAHKCADLVFSHTSGEPGYFDSNLAIIAGQGAEGAQQTRVAIIDSDGFNPRDISPGARLVAAPAISRDGRKIAYMMVEANEPVLMMLDRTTGSSQRITMPGGAISMPAFSADGQSLLVTISRDGDADIFRYDLRTGGYTQLTRTFGADTAASYSPDGQKIVFQSDRSGTPQIYVMNADGSAPVRISFGAGQYETPTWSPRGDRIAFTQVTPTGMQIGTMRIDGTAIQLLPAPWQDESPSWAASGRLLVFTRTLRAGPAELWISDLAGKRQRKLGLTVPASQASWSGLLP